MRASMLRRTTVGICDSMDQATRTTVALIDLSIEHADDRAGPIKGTSEIPHQK